MLLEVVITSLIVGLITIATLTGFNAVDKTTAAQRQHDEASFLAAESQEALRSDPASALELLETTPHQYTQSSGGNTYSITQQAKILGAGESSAACSVTKKSRQSANAIRVTSTVTWPEQQKGHRPGVVESGLITPPTGSGFEVDAGNAPNPTAGVSNITAQVQYTATKGGAPATVEQTTGSEGCVIFTGIPATSALVSIKESIGYVTITGSTEYPTKEVTLAPNYTTHDPVVYNLGGAVKANFAYNGESKYTHANNEANGEVTETVTGDTFVASNTAMNAEPDFELGSTRARLGPGGIYEALPGEEGKNYEATATSPKEASKYPNGNLFPFLGKTEKEKGENAWAIYAGDCTANNPETVTNKVITVPENISVSPALTTSVPKVPMSYVSLGLYKVATKSEVEAKTHAWEALETGATKYPVTITNTKCAGITPNNEAEVNNEHKQLTTTGTTNGGHLEDPFQPFGEFTLCVYSASTKRTYSVGYTNTAGAKGELQGGTPNIYLGMVSKSEREATKKADETTEKSNEALWKSEYSVKHTITLEAYNAKEAARKAAKTTRENQEKAEETAEAKITVESGKSQCQ